MLAPPSYVFLRSAATFSRAAPVTRLPFLRVSTTHAASKEVRSVARLIAPRGLPGHPLGQVRLTTFGAAPTRTRGRARTESDLPPRVHGLFPGRGGKRAGHHGG